MFYLENKLKKSIFYPEKIEGVYFLSRKKIEGVYVLSRKKPEGINVVLSRKNRRSLCK